MHVFHILSSYKWGGNIIIPFMNLLIHYICTFIYTINRIHLTIYSNIMKSVVYPMDQTIKLVMFFPEWRFSEIHLFKEKGKNYLANIWSGTFGKYKYVGAMLIHGGYGGEYDSNQTVVVHSSVLNDYVKTAVNHKAA